MGSGVISWSVNGSRTFSGFSELEEIINELEGCKDPILADIVIENGDIMSIGIGGGDDTVLTFMSANLDPPYFHSLGQCDSDEYIVYFYYDEWTELPRNTLIPKAVAMGAVAEFVNFGRRSDKVKWEMD